MSNTATILLTTFTDNALICYTDLQLNVIRQDTIVKKVYVEDIKEFDDISDSRKQFMFPVERPISDVEEYLNS